MNMGLFHVRVKVTGPTGRSEDLDLLVDSGATFVVLPRPVADRLELRATRTVPFQTAGGRTETWPVAEVRVTINDLAAETRKLALQQFTEDRHDEAQRTIAWLNDFYGARDGLQRPHGLCKDSTLDAGGITVWLFDTYLRARIDGGSEGLARQKVVDAIRSSGEWRSVHSGSAAP